MKMKGNQRSMSLKKQKLVLLSGIPATGKSTFGSWAEKEKGVMYWDLENETLEDVGARENLYLGTDHDLISLLDAIKDKDYSMIVDWGFPPDTMLGQVRSFKDAGFELWWFDGDRDAARHSFIDRGTVSSEALDIQMRKIDDCWPQIQSLFGENIVQAINSDLEYIPPEKIYKMIFEK